jgi:hypothetical protein
MILFQTFQLLEDIIGEELIVTNLIKMFTQEEKLVINILIMIVMEFMESVILIKNLMKVYIVMAQQD